MEILNQIPQHFIDLFKIEIMEKYLLTNGATIHLDSIKSIDSDSNPMVIHTKGGGVFLYQHGEMSIVIN